jgi:phosphoglycerate dehydrogenase-like enzyme
MRTFRIAYTGDFLNPEGKPAHGDVGTSEFDAVPFIQYHFIKELAPNPDDPTYYDRLYSLEVKPEYIEDVDALIVLRPWIKPEVFANGADNLTVIGRFGVGYDKIDADALTANDVALFNAPDALTHSTGSSAFLFMLALSKRLKDQERITREGRWDLQAAVQGSDLPGKTLGIIGLGNTGRELARLAGPWNMRILAYSPKADPAQAAALNVKLVGLDELLRESDFVSFHCRLLPETRGFFRAREFRLMKPTAYLINVGRGELLDEHALIETLREKRIAGAGLDVFEHEPLPLSSPLLQLDNVIVTPHWLPATKDTTPLVARVMVDGMLRAAQGLIPDTVCNPEVLERPGFKKKLARFNENQSYPSPPAPLPIGEGGEEI